MAEASCSQANQPDSMGCLAVSHPTYYDLQWPGQGASMWDSVARASGCLLQSLHILHLLHWILPATGSHMPVLPAHYSQGESLLLPGLPTYSIKFAVKFRMSVQAFCDVTNR